MSFGSFLSEKSTGLLLAWILLSASEAAAQTAKTLYFPRLVSTNGTSTDPDNSEYTGVAVANLGLVSATLTFTAYDKSGASISGSGITNPASRTLAAGAQLPIVDTQIFGAALASRSATGWIKMDSSAIQVVGFFLVFNGSLGVLDGADVSSNTLTTFILPEIDDQGFTQVHVVNPNTAAARVRLELRASDGSIRGTADRTVGPNGAVIELVADLFPTVAVRASDYIRATSDRGVAAFEYFGRVGRFAQGLTGQDTTGAQNVYSPQYVIGGSAYRTTVSIVNLSSRPGTLFLWFFGNNGVTIGMKEMAILGNGKIHITDQAFFTNAGDTITQGYLEIRGTTGLTLGGSVVFGDPDRTTFSSALPLVSKLLTSVVFSQVASNSTYFTGVALLNPSSSAANTTIEVRDDQGALVVSQAERIAARNRKSQLLTQFFPALLGQNRSSGYVRVDSDRPIASFALFGTSDLSVLSAVPPQEHPGYEGKWVGTTGAGNHFQFTVSNNRVTEVILDFRFAGQLCPTFVTAPSGGSLATITDGRFTINFTPTGLTTTITGSFASTTQFSGSYGTVSTSNLRCGNATVNGSFAGGTLTASR